LKNKIKTLESPCEILEFVLKHKAVIYSEFVQIICLQGKRFFYVTNNSAKTREEFAKKLTKLGFPATEVC